MAKSYRQLLIDLDVHERLLEVRTGISDLVFAVDEQLGIASVVSILLDHFKERPPETEWLREKAMERPRRGRPRSSSQSYVPALRGVKATDKKGGHDYQRPKARPEITLCRRCGDVQFPDSFGPPSVCNPGMVTHRKSDLIAFGFSDEEVAWADG